MAQDSQVVTGKFLGAMPTEAVGQNGFLVRRFYVDITTNPEWPNTPEFQLRGDKVSLVDNLQKGQTIQVKYNLNGRKFDNTAKGGKKGVITNLDAWKIDVVQMQSAGTPVRAVAAPAPARPAPASAPTMAGPGNYAPAGTGSFPVAAESGDNDLPF